MSWLRWCFLLFFTVRLAHADGGPAFDLDGPRIQAKVTRNGKTLPIGAVASLAAGDLCGCIRPSRKRRRAVCAGGGVSAWIRQPASRELVHQGGHLE